jgi:hypothetical protein
VGKYDALVFLELLLFNKVRVPEECNIKETLKKTIYSWLKLQRLTNFMQRGINHHDMKITLIYTVNWRSGNTFLEHYCAMKFTNE